MAQLQSIDPATDEVIGEVQVATASAVRQAIDAARDAQGAWAATPVAERAKLLDRFRSILVEQRDDVALLLTREAGKPRIESLMADVLPTLDFAAHVAKRARRELRPDKFRLHNPLLADRRSEVRRDPLGVVGVIAPWNYPLSIPATAVLTALVAGNAVVLKPAPQTPLVGQRLADLLDQAGLPDGLLHVVQGKAAPGKALAQGDIDGLHFTGSVPTGQAVAAACSGRFIPTCLELGGKDPMVVLDDANVPLAARGALWGAMTNAGQTCASVERVYVDEAHFDEFRSRASAGAAALRVGPGTGSVDMGPLIDDDAVKRVMGQIRAAEKAGATIETGGEVLEEVGSRFVAPTVITGVTHDMAVMRDETFGPVMPIMAAGEDEAVRLANDSEYGLCASVWGRDKERARRVADQIGAGTVTINDCVYTYAATETPWTGVRNSGIGSSHGAWGLDEVTRIRHINNAPAGRKKSLWYYPYDENLDRLMDDGVPILYGKGLERAAAPKLAPSLLRRLRR